MLINAMIKLTLIWTWTRLTHCPDDGGSTHLWNVGLLQRDYTTQYTRRLSPSYSPPWKPQILHVLQGSPYPKPDESNPHPTTIPWSSVNSRCFRLPKSKLYTHFALHTPPISSFDLIIIIPGAEYKILSSSSLLSLHPSYVQIFFSGSSSHAPQCLCSLLNVSAPSFTRTQNNTITVL
jgi:hypothetical protein